MFSSLMKQNKKAKICFVIHIAGEKKLLFSIYFVIVKQNFINGLLITTPTRGDSKVRPCLLGPSPTRGGKFVRPVFYTPLSGPTSCSSSSTNNQVGVVTVTEPAKFFPHLF